MADQAARLRALVQAHRARRPAGGQAAASADRAPAIAVLGARSGCGTTTVVAGLREALAARRYGGWRVLSLPAGADGARAAAALAPRLVLVVTGPEATSVLGAYAACKVLARRSRETTRLGVVVNRASGLAAATAVAGRIVAVARRFLNVTVDVLGRVPADPSVVAAAATGEGLRARRPLGPAARAFDELARACGPVRRPVPETKTAHPRLAPASPAVSAADLS